MSQIDNIRKRLAAIAPRKWTGKRAAADSPFDWVVFGGQYDESELRAEAEFIANAPEDIRYLLSQIEKLEVIKRYALYLAEAACEGLPLDQRIKNLCTAIKGFSDVE